MDEYLFRRAGQAAIRMDPRTLEGEPPGVYDLIGPTFEQLAGRADRDISRPGIEFYRRETVIDLLLPIL